VKNDLKIRTSIANVTEDEILVRGRPLIDLVGRMNFVDAFFFQMRGRVPSEKESRLLSALMVNSLEHGINHPVGVARMTYGFAPEAIQGAIAAGILGMGKVIDGAIELVAELLYTTAAEADRRKISDEEAAAEVVSRFRSEKKFIPGLGHPKHKSGDPRTGRLFELSEELGFNGRYVKLLKLIAQKATAAYDRDLPINGAAAVASMYCELGIPAPIAKAITIVALSAGITGHLMEEIKSPTARTMRALISSATEYVEPETGDAASA
jgi:citrate synthase